MGWGEELDKLDESAVRPENHTTVIKACQKDLTEKGKSSLRPVQQPPSKQHNSSIIQP